MATLWHTCADARESELLGKPSFPLACARGVGSVLTVCGARGEVCAGLPTDHCTSRRVLGPGGDSTDCDSVVMMLKQELPCYLLKTLIAAACSNEL